MRRGLRLIRPGSELLVKKRSPGPAPMANPSIQAVCVPARDSAGCARHAGGSCCSCPAGTRAAPSGYVRLVQDRHPRYRKNPEATWPVRTIVRASRKTRRFSSKTRRVTTNNGGGVWHDSRGGWHGHACRGHDPPGSEGVGDWFGSLGEEVSGTCRVVRLQNREDLATIQASAMSTPSLAVP